MTLRRMGGVSESGGENATSGGSVTSTLALSREGTPPSRRPGRPVPGRNITSRSVDTIARETALCGQAVEALQVLRLRRLRSSSAQIGNMTHFLKTAVAPLRGGRASVAGRIPRGSDNLSTFRQHSPESSVLHKF